MKLHFFDAWHISHKPHVSHSDRYYNVKYGTLLVLGIPVVALGSMYVVDLIFNFLVR